jgi:hypothetical protein
MRNARSLAQFILASAAVLSLADCRTEPTAPTAALGPLIARESLTVADGDQVPCCTVTSSDARVTIVGGALSLYALAHFVDTVFTPAGLMSRACVQQVPNGASISLNRLVTLPDGSTYLLLPCSVGTYRLTLTKHVDYPDGSSQTYDVLLGSGAFNWRRDTLTLTDSERAPVAASLSGATVDVTVPGHRYQFVTMAIR